MTEETGQTIVDKASFSGFVQYVESYFRHLLSTENLGIFLDCFLVVTFVGGLLVLLWRFCYLLFRYLRAAIAYRNLRRSFHLRSQMHSDAISGPPLLQRIQQMRDESQISDNIELTDSRAAGDSLAQNADHDMGRSQIMVMFLQGSPSDDENSENSPPSAQGIIMAQNIMEEMRRMSQPTGLSSQSDQRSAQNQDENETSSSNARPDHENRPNMIQASPMEDDVSTVRESDNLDVQNL